MTKRIDVATLPVIIGTLYPPPFDEPCRARQRTRLADAAGLTQCGVNLVRLKPRTACGGKSSSDNRGGDTWMSEFHLTIGLRRIFDPLALLAGSRPLSLSRWAAEKPRK